MQDSDERNLALARKEEKSYESLVRQFDNNLKAVAEKRKVLLTEKQVLLEQIESLEENDETSGEIDQINLKVFDLSKKIKKLDGDVYQSMEEEREAQNYLEVLIYYISKIIF